MFSGSRLLRLLPLLVMGAPAFAQPLDLHVLEVDLSEFPKVQGIFSLQSPHKFDFRDLNKSNFGLVEEEVPIEDFEVEQVRDRVSIGLVLDDSGSMDPELQNLKRALYKLIDLMGPHDHAAVVNFSREIQVVTPLTSDKSALIDAVGRLKAYGATALYDALTIGIAEVFRGHGKRAIVVVTDGNDQAFTGGPQLSRDNVPNVIGMARTHNVEIYAVGLGPRVDHHVLNDLCRATGGAYYPSPKPEELIELFERLGMSMYGTFKISYMSPKPVEDDLLRQVRIWSRVAGHRGSELFGYTLTDKSPSETVAVKREKVHAPDLGDIRVVAMGVRDVPLALNLYLHDSENQLARHAITSPDGKGRLDGEDPELVNIKPGMYRLELEVPGTTLRYVHPGIEVKAGQTKQYVYRFSKLAFRRNGMAWYDTPHPMGDTSDLIRVKILKADKKPLYEGRLIDFKEGGETFVWLEQGRYTVELDNYWDSVEGPDIERAVLENKLTAEVLVPGTNQLFFDVVHQDFVFAADPEEEFPHDGHVAMSTPIYHPVPLQSGPSTGAGDMEKIASRPAARDHYYMDMARTVTRPDPSDGVIIGETVKFDAPRPKSVFPPPTPRSTPVAAGPSMGRTATPKTRVASVTSGEVLDLDGSIAAGGGLERPSVDGAMMAAAPVAAVPASAVNHLRDLAQSLEKSGVPSSRLQELAQSLKPGRSASPVPAAPVEAPSRTTRAPSAVSAPRASPSPSSTDAWERRAASQPAPTYSLRHPGSASLDEAALGAIEPSIRRPITATPAQTPKLKKLVEELKKTREDAQRQREEGGSSRFTLGLRPRSNGSRTGAMSGGRRVYLPDDLLAYGTTGEDSGSEAGRKSSSSGKSSSSKDSGGARAGGKSAAAAGDPDVAASGKPATKKGMKSGAVNQLRDLLGPDGTGEGAAGDFALQGSRPAKAGTTGSRTASKDRAEVKAVEGDERAGRSRDEDPYAIPTGFEPDQAAADPEREREELAGMVRDALKDAKRSGSEPAPVKGDRKERWGTSSGRDLEGSSEAVRNLIETVESRRATVGGPEAATRAEKRGERATGDEGAPLFQFRADPRDGGHLRSHPAPIVRKLAPEAEIAPTIQLSPEAEREAWGEGGTPKSSLRTEADSIESLRRMLTETEVTPDTGAKKSTPAPKKSGKAQGALDKLREVSSEEAPGKKKAAVEKKPTTQPPAMRAVAPNPYLKIFENEAPSGEAYQ